MVDGGHDGMRDSEDINIMNCFLAQWKCKYKRRRRKFSAARIKAGSPIALAVKGEIHKNWSEDPGHHNDQSKTKRPPRKAAAATAKIESLPILLGVRGSLRSGRPGWG